MQHMKYYLLAVLLGLVSSFGGVAAEDKELVFKAGHPSLQHWLLPDEVPFPADNKPTPQRVELGKKLFFDPRLSRHGNMSCASCHNPSLGWSDGLPTARGFKSQSLDRATPTVVNTAFNSIQMWDGRKATLEDQAMGPMEASVEMNADLDKLFAFLRTNSEYKQSFENAYPGEGINEDTLSKAIASFERTVISNNSPFDRWVRGDSSAMTPQQVRGFQLFVDADKGNCAVCHEAPNFTDNGFHNVGLSSFGEPDADMGRYKQVPVKVLKGAFKTPTLRDISRTAPYFHDGSAATLMQVMDHYTRGGVVKTNLDPNMKQLNLSEQEKKDIVAFMRALSSESKTMVLPVLPPQQGKTALEMAEVK